MKVKIKKLHPDAIIPKYAKDGDAAMDLFAVSRNPVMGQSQLKYGTGLAFEIPEGHVGLIYPRSSITKMAIRLANCTGVIDSGYRGEVSFIFDVPHPNNGEYYKVGDRIGQIMIVPYPKIEFDEVEELSETSRGIGGFGSTGS